MSQPGTDLAEHLSLLRRRRLLFAGCLLTCAAAALTLWKLTPPAYTATTEVLVAPVGVQEQNNQITNRQRESLNLDTEAQIAQSSVVAARAAESLKVQDLEPAEVSVPPNSSVLTIAVTAADPATAARQSEAYAQAYLANRTESAQTALAAQQKVLLTKLKQVNGTLSDTAEALTKLRKGTAEHAMATHRQNVLNRQAYSLTMKYDGLKTVALTPGTVISAATPPAAPSAPSLPLHLGAGLMLGLLLGSTTAYTRDRLDTRLRTPADVERLTGLSVLAHLGKSLGKSLRKDLGKDLGEDFGTDLGEKAGKKGAQTGRKGTEEVALHDLASSVVAALAGRPGRRLLIRAVPPQPGAHPMTASLAARAPLSVLSGCDVGDLAGADAALLVITLRKARAADAAAAVRHLTRHNVPVIGVVTITGELPPLPEEKSRALPRQSRTLDKLVVPAGDAAVETTPMPAIKATKDAKDPA
ncbi:Wzz/FepE/Etk N-terminal domain-containing protein [Nonomuraea typhae]|uniref:Wzz/FepE/Etk N-terminal domain-containing protein n=1 Tax=Nonomuraea typhae TaxID=2603600 RepID=UPI0012F94D4B|nr:Wzz/FepE/Etk N-terminal domain-containing protein [Nonomuraea typhae]